MDVHRATLAPTNPLGQTQLERRGFSIVIDLQVHDAIMLNSRSAMRQTEFTIVDRSAQRTRYPRGTTVTLIVVSSWASELCGNIATLSLPRYQPRNPSRNIDAENFVTIAEHLAQCRLFVGQHEEMKAEPHDRAVPQQAHVAEQQRLPKNDGDDTDIHGIADIAIEAADNQTLRRRDRRRRAQTFEDKLHEGCHERNEPEKNYGDAGQTDLVEMEEPRRHLPARERPRQEPGQRPRRNDEEDQRPDGSPELSHGPFARQRLN